MFWPGSGGRNLCQILLGFLPHPHPLNTQWSGGRGYHWGPERQRLWTMVSGTARNRIHVPAPPQPQFFPCLPRPPPSCRGLWSIFPWSLFPGADSNQPRAYDLIQDARGEKTPMPLGDAAKQSSLPSLSLGEYDRSQTRRALHWSAVSSSWCLRLTFAGRQQGGAAL